MLDQAVPLNAVPRAGDRLWVVGDLYTFKLTGAETGGALTAFEVPVSPGGGPPLHTHAQEDESFYILEGEVQFTVDGRTFTATAGTMVHGPRGVSHRFTNVSDQMARMLIVSVPAGIERFFAEIGDPVSDPAGPAPAPNVQRIIDTAPRYGMTMHPPE